MRKKQPEITVAEAKKITAELKRDVTQHWWRIGERILEAQRLGVPAKLDLTFDDWLTEVAPDSRSALYADKRIVEALGDLPRERVMNLSRGAAEQIARLPEKKREKWIDRAESETVPTLKHAVDTELNGGTPAHEEFRCYRVILPLAVYEALLAAERKIAGMLSVDLENKPQAARIVIIEALAQLVNDTDERVLRTEIIGANEPAQEARVQ